MERVGQSDQLVQKMPHSIGYSSETRSGITPRFWYVATIRTFWIVLQSTAPSFSSCLQTRLRPNTFSKDASWRIDLQPCFGLIAWAVFHLTVNAITAHSTELRSSRTPTPV